MKNFTNILTMAIFIIAIMPLALPTETKAEQDKWVRQYSTMASDSIYITNTGHNSTNSVCITTTADSQTDSVIYGRKFTQLVEFDTWFNYWEKGTVANNIYPVLYILIHHNDTTIQVGNLTPVNAGTNWTYIKKSYEGSDILHQFDSVSLVINYLFTTLVGNYTFYLDDFSNYGKVVNPDTFYLGGEIGSLAGNIFIDENQNTTHDNDEQPTADWKVYIKDTTLDSTTTDSSGNYIFQNIPRGTYKIYAEKINGWTQTYPEVDTSYVTIGDTLYPTLNFGVYILPEVAYRFNKRWNIVSLPKNVTDASVANVFPTAISQAFGYNDGYHSMETLEVGKGYWLKFANTQYVSITGDSSTSTTIQVQEGWNMIGSLTGKMPTNYITSNPPGIVTSSFYAYENGYKNVDTLYPGQGYWVKVEQTGEFTMSLYDIIPGTQIRIVHSSEMPPPPPEMEIRNPKSEIPSQMKLLQNYPNPFNPSTSIKFEVNSSKLVTLKVYNILGEEIAELVNKVMESGSHEVTFDASHLNSGIYFYRLHTIEVSITKKMLLLK